MSRKIGASTQIPGRKKPIFKKLAIEGTDWWETVIKNENIQSHHLRAADTVVTYYFYLGNWDKAREISNLHSVFMEQMARNNIMSGGLNRATMFFQAGLFRSLSGKTKESNLIWQNLIDFCRDHYPEDEVVEDNESHIWIYEAYALAKLSQYRESLEMSKKGLQNIVRERAISRDPNHRPLDFYLGSVLTSLALYQLNATPSGKRAAQEALFRYREAGFKYNRFQSYSLIFDLQFSYPDVFDPILPGPDPDKE